MKLSKIMSLFGNCTKNCFKKKFCFLLFVILLKAFIVPEFSHSSLARENILYNQLPFFMCKIFNALLNKHKHGI